MQVCISGVTYDHKVTESITLNATRSDSDHADYTVGQDHRLY